MQPGVATPAKIEEPAPSGGWILAGWIALILTMAATGFVAWRSYGLIVG